MDHIPYPNHLNVPPISVPYLGIFEFDHGEFGTFNKRLVVDECSLDQIAALAQAWLYFGLLEAFFGKEIDRNMFLRKARASEITCNEYVIDSSPLSGLLNDCVRRIRRSIKLTERQRQLRVWRKVLDIAQNEITHLEEVSRCDETNAAIFLSINILTTTLRDFYFRMDSLQSFQRLNWGSNPSPMNRRMPQFVSVLRHRYHDRPSPGALLLMKRMKEAGWCVQQLSQFLEKSDFVVAYYLSSIPRIEDVTHDSCARVKCIAHDINNNTYATKHVENACQCNIIDAPYHAINCIVAAGGIPLIRIKQRPGTQPLLDVIECKSDTDYTAISHVWIDGLGNPKSNGLPICQIEKLAEQMIQFQQQSLVSWPWRTLKRHQTPLIWIDTFCVPVNPEHKDLRIKAINAMSLIYTGAKQVLVLDNELRRIDSETEPIKLLYARIFSSKWNSRSWTLQESALARKCYFQFRDNALQLAPVEQNSVTSFFRLLLRALKNPRGLLLCVWDVWCFPHWRPPLFYSGVPVFLKNPLPSGFQTMSEYVQRSLHILAFTRFDLGLSNDVIQIFSDNLNRQRSHNILSPRQKFERTWNMLGQRTTTYLDDLHVIIANLTGFNISQIMALMSPFERTKTMLHCIGSFDIGFMINDYPRQEMREDCADRWIPSFPTPDQLTGEVGLAIEERGMTLHGSVANRFLTFIIKPGCFIEKFWVRYERLCRNPTCGCRKDAPNSATNGAGDIELPTREDRLEVELLGDRGEIHEGSLEGWLRQWPLDPEISTFEPSPFYVINDRGEHIYNDWYYIECKLPENDKLDRSRYEDKGACIVLSSPQSNSRERKLRGARFLQTGRPEADGKVHLRYDCPLIYTIWKKARNDLQLRTSPIIPITRRLSYKDILIECETDPQIQSKYPTRDYITLLHSSNYIWSTFTTNLVAVMLIIAFVLFIGLTTNDILRQIRRHNSNPENSEDEFTWRVYLPKVSCVVLLILVWFFFVLWRRRMREKVFQLWKETFQEDWKPVGAHNKVRQRRIEMLKKRDIEHKMRTLL